LLHKLPLILLACTACASLAHAQDLKVDIESVSTFDLKAVYVSPAGTQGWQPASLRGTTPMGGEVVAGGSGEFVLTAERPTCVYDLRFEMDSEVTFHDFNVDLCRQSAYTLQDMFE